MHGWIVICAAVLVLAAKPAWADDCSTANTQTDMNACAYQAYLKSDAGLNATYRAITARLQGKDAADIRQSLVAAQKAWIGFRDSQCDFEASGVTGGSIQPMIRAMCLDHVTRSRTAELQTFLHCKEGDLDCPVPAH